MASLHMLQQQNRPKALVIYCFLIYHSLVDLLRQIVRLKHATWVILVDLHPTIHLELVIELYDLEQ